MEKNGQNLTLHTMNTVRSNNLSLKNQRFTPSGFKDIWIRKFEFAAKKNLNNGWSEWTIH